MHASDLPADPDLSIPTLPVICDQCRAAGMAGDAAFSAIPDLLDFTPVPRRARADGWKEEHQRAFIAALAITGSPRQAARAIGKHQFGAEGLRNARGGKSFAAAWDAAIELARERETHRIQGNLAELARQREAELDSVRPERGEGRIVRSEDYPPGYDPEIDSDERLEYLEGKMRIRARLLKARRALLMLISTDPEKRKAWEVLAGPVDWDRAERLEPQDDEPCPDPERNPQGMPSMRKADMVLTVEAGLLPEMTGGYDAMAEIRQALAADPDVPG